MTLIETRRGELWFGGNAISRVPPSALAQPSSGMGRWIMKYSRSADGLATAQIGVGCSESGAVTRTARVWAATGKGLAQFDLRRLPITNAKPSIYLTNVTIGRDTAPPRGREIGLPPGTNHVEIQLRGHRDLFS